MTAAAPFSAIAAPRPRLTSRRLGLILGAAVVAVYVLVALFAEWLAPYDPLMQNLTARLEAPSPAHPFGTDHLGRDLLSRVMFGARPDLLIGILGAGLAAVIGSTLGLISGYRGGWLDVVLTRLMDIMQTLPTIVVLVALLLLFGSDMRGIVVAIVVTAWVPYARLMRSEALVVRGQDYVTAARLAGFSEVRVLFRQVLPNTWIQSVVYMTTDIIMVIVAVASLGYLGIGIQPPTPEWGSIIAEGQVYLATAPWMTLITGVVIAILGVALTLLSDSLTDDRTGTRR